jgi:hypothetical protein
MRSCDGGAHIDEGPYVASQHGELWVCECIIYGMCDMGEAENGSRWILGAQTLDQVTADKA